MPARNKSPARGRGGGDVLLKDDLKHYKKAWERMRDAERINLDRAMANKFLWDKLKKLKPQASCEDLMALAHALEDRGQLEEAVAAYQQLLTAPQFQQQDNVELRTHLAHLVAQVNRRQAEAQALRRQAEFEEDGRQPPGRPRGLEPPLRAAGVPRNDRPVGPQMPLSPEAYRAELAAQAMEARRRREAAKLQEELLDAKQMAVAAAMEALEKHRKHVMGRNDKIAHARDQDMVHQAREEERRRQFHMEWDQLKTMATEGPGGPLSGLDEYGRRRAQQQGSVRAAVAGGGGGGPRPRRPASAGPVSAAAAAAAADRARQLDRNNAANFSRLYVPGHPYAPAGGPPSPAVAWPEAPVGQRVVAVKAVKAPFDRPDVDRPKVPIDPKAVRARQQVFLDKHRKPEARPRQEVPLRLRKEAQRRPEQPQIAAW